ncbi:MAG TPA: pyrroline-5-carboxylate reductase [Myxococcota bacterium]|jgi:pyrroline-5-carboxylate reductase
MTLADRRIGFIGGGAMAEALAGGLIAAGVAPGAILASDVSEGRRQRLSSALGVAVTDDNTRVARESDVVVIAVKPGMVEAALAGFAAGAAGEAPLWISIAAGVPLERLARSLPARARIVRAMPNTPALVRAGATALCGNPAAGAGDLALAQALFEGVGMVWVAAREEQLDAVTGLSGSGPAYVFSLLEALGAAGERMGLPRAAADRLAVQTVFGAAKLALETERPPAELRKQVSSPGGTTLAGLARLEALGFAAAIDSAVEAATRRSKELGKTP